MSMKPSNVGQKGFSWIRGLMEILRSRTEKNQTYELNLASFITGCAVLLQARLGKVKDNNESMGECRIRRTGWGSEQRGESKQRPDRDKVSGRQRHTGVYA